MNVINLIRNLICVNLHFKYVIPVTLLFLSLHFSSFQNVNLAGSSYVTRVVDLLSGPVISINNNSSIDFSTMMTLD